MFSIKKDTLRRGEYRNYTFRMPAHVPELTFSIVAERGPWCKRPGRRERRCAGSRARSREGRPKRRKGAGVRTGGQGNQLA